jgi:putative DNA primase/helicase
MSNPGADKPSVKSKKASTDAIDAALDKYLADLEDREERTNQQPDNSQASTIPAKDAHIKLVHSVNTPANDVWKKNLLRKGKKGEPLAVLANVVLALKEAPQLQGMLSYNAHALCKIILKRPPWEKITGDSWTPRRWVDQDDRELCIWLQRNIGLMVNHRLAAEGADTVAIAKSFYPLQEYFRKLEWDGKPRIDDWLVTYLGAKATPFTKAIGPRYLISCVARAVQPGCQADCMLILEGSQGAGKTSALRVLAGKAYFTDEIKLSGDKDAIINLAGKWIVEFSELEAFKGASLERLKMFLSRTIDTYRPLWGRAATDNPRQFVFAGTTNKKAYLEDPTGNRRFWPVECGKIDLKALEADRDQLWAEAYQRYLAGAPWWLETPDMERLAFEEQDDRYEPDPWEVKITQFLQSLDPKATEVTTDDILRKCLKVDTYKLNRHDQMRVGAIMQHLGWPRVRVSTHGWRHWVYKKP